MQAWEVFELRVFRAYGRNKGLKMPRIKLKKGKKVQKRRNIAQKQVKMILYKHV